MSQVIPNGGSRTSQDLYTGAPNEITVDTSNKELRLHDGATAGGERIPNLDTIDATYQRKNPELDGLKFDPNQKGFLARLAAGVYRLRKWVNTDGTITITNPDGVGGDVGVSLPTTVPGDREFDGDVIITGVAQINGGMNGDTAGTHTGATNGAHTGDVDVRGHTLQLDDGQIPESAVNGLVAALSGLAFPKGGIVLWSGTIESIPANWHLCDGTSGTPDLRGRFLLGAGTDTQINSTGGGSTHTHIVTSESAGAHQHNINVDPFQLLPMHMPSHNHGNGATDNNNPGVMNHGTIPANPSTTSGIASIDDVVQHHDPGSDGIYEGLTTSAGGDTPHAHTAESDSQGAHVHIIDVTAADHTPPYYALAYIMKIA